MNLSATIQPVYLEVMPISLARTRPRHGQHPPCDMPGCPLKRAIFVLDHYVDYDYLLLPRLEAAQESPALPVEIAHYLLAEYARWQGKPHHYSTTNFCYNCLHARV